MPQIDEHSQLLGTLAAQIAALSERISDLRAEVLTNRINAQTWKEDLTTKLDLVQAEYRNVKHDERSAEAASAVLTNRLGQMERRLGEIERIILVWRVRAGVIVAITGAIGAIVGLIFGPIGVSIMNKVFG